MRGRDRGRDGCIVRGRDRGRGWVHCEGEGVGALCEGEGMGAL